MARLDAIPPHHLQARQPSSPVTQVGPPGRPSCPHIQAGQPLSLTSLSLTTDRLVRLDAPPARTSRPANPSPAPQGYYGLLLALVAVLVAPVAWLREPPAAAPPHSLTAFARCAPR